METADPPPPAPSPHAHLSPRRTPHTSCTSALAAATRHGLQETSRTARGSPHPRHSSIPTAPPQRQDALQQFVPPARVRDTASVLRPKSAPALPSPSANTQ